MLRRAKERGPPFRRGRRTRGCLTLFLSLFPPQSLRMESVDDFREFGCDVGFVYGYGSEPLDTLHDCRVECLAVLFGFQRAEEGD